jgi:hypothetical protein
MRIWSLHPRYLDTKWLLAVWRETLLAKHVLEGKTKGYKNHPQLIRFRAFPHPLSAINSYLGHIFDEATSRGYHFSQEKFTHISENVQIPVTQGQVEYEWKHLLRKLEIRDPERYKKLEKELPILHPIFYEVPGEVEEWEKI